LRRQAGHKQSTPSSGIGSRIVSSLHQHAPSGLQPNAVPQAEQLTVREEMISFQFVMQSRGIRRGFNVGFITDDATMIANDYSSAVS
jgi:hypothetical protein